MSIPLLYQLYALYNLWGQDRFNFESVFLFGIFHFFFIRPEWHIESLIMYGTILKQTLSVAESKFAFFIFIAHNYIIIMYSNCDMVDLSVQTALDLSSPSNTLKDTTKQIKLVVPSYSYQLKYNDNNKYPPFHFLSVQTKYLTHTLSITSHRH